VRQRTTTRHQPPSQGGSHGGEPRGFGSDHWDPTPWQKPGPSNSPKRFDPRRVTQCRSGHCRLSDRLPIQPPSAVRAPPRQLADRSAGRMRTKSRGPRSANIQERGPGSDCGWRGPSVFSSRRGLCVFSWSPRPALERKRTSRRDSHSSPYRSIHRIGDRRSTSRCELTSGSLGK